MIGLPSPHISSFEWDENKRLKCIEKHRIDFRAAAKALKSQPFLQYRSVYSDEERYVGICELEGIEIAVVYTIRDDVCRIITARRARREERRDYHAHVDR